MTTTKDALNKASYYWFRPGQLKHAPKGHSLYDMRSEEPPDPVLMASMTEHGWIGPPMQATSEDGDLIITDGRRRHRAAEALAKKKVEIRCKVEIAKGEGYDSMIVGNLGRKEETPYQVAIKVKRGEDMGFSVEELAAKFAVTTQAIRDYLALANAPKDVRDAVKAGEVPAHLAKELAKKPPEERKEILADGPVRGAAGKERIRTGRPASAKVPARVVKNLYQEIPANASGFEGYTRALLGVLLGSDPEGKALVSYAGGAEILAKIKPQAQPAAK